MVTTTEPETARAGRVRPVGALRKVARSAATTPGRLTIVAVGLVVLTAVTGLIGAVSLQQKQKVISNLIEHREPLAAAAQEIYRSLSDADATAASAFLSGGVTPPALRDRYELDIARAGASLATASADVGGVPEAEEQVQQLARYLPVYTGLVETARANNRQGFPAGAAYLREASGLMRSKLLPAAHELYTIDFDRLAAEESEARSFPWFTAALVAALLAALIATQVYLTRKTNRLLNVGLLVATIAVVLGLGWTSVALLLGSARVADGHEQGSQQVELLVQARINALKCRADETLTLVARGDGEEYQQEWERLVTTFSGDSDENLLLRAERQAADPELADKIRQARRSADAWVAAHQQIREMDEGGQYSEAVAMAIGDSPDAAATRFEQLDKGLLAALNQARERFAAETGRAEQLLTGLVPGIAVLTVISAAGITMGVRQRLQEYR